MTMYPQPPAPYPVPVARPSNGLGVAGFIVSLLGFITCGILWPVGLFLSFIGMFRRPRGFAFAGFVISLVGTVLLAVVVGFFGVVIFSLAGLVRYGVGPAFTTITAIIEAEKDINSFRSTHAGALPDDVEGEALAAPRLDGWGKPLRYRRVGPGGYQLQSSGPDGLPLTADDVSTNFDTPMPEKP